jgi:hypothetical protein
LKQSTGRLTLGHNLLQLHRIIAVPPYVDRMASSIWLKDTQIRNELKNTLSKQFECPIAKSKIQQQNQYIDDAIF